MSKLATLENLGLQVMTSLPTKPLCLPNQVNTVMDTAKFWATLIGGALAVVGLILIGIGMFFQHRRGDGGEVMKSMGWWIGGALILGTAGVIAGIFIPGGQTDCVKSL